MSVTVEDFLEHHGVKGQHWGIRNVRKDLRNLKTRVNNNKKLKVGLEIGAGVAAAGAIAAGAVFAHKLLLSHQAMKATDLRTLWSKGNPAIFSSPVMKTRVSSLPKGSFSSINIKGLKKLKKRETATAVGPGFNKGLSNFAKSVKAQDLKNATTRAAVLKTLKSMRISVG